MTDISIEQFSAEAEAFLAANAELKAESQAFVWGEGADDPSLFEEVDRERERAELETELAAVRRSLDQTETDVPIDVVEDFCYHALEVLDTGDVEDVRALLRTFIVRIEVEQHRGRIVYGFP